jgi:hypothetical protein
MRSGNPAAALLLVSLLAGCGGSGSSAPSGGGGQHVSAANVVPITVDAIEVTDSQNPNQRATYFNRPTVSVTLCTPDGATCQTINEILLDTGSYGLRVFRNAVTLPLIPTASGGGTLAECVTYADNSSSWGPVADATVVLGGEPGVRVPIQLVDSAFPGIPASCPNPDVSRAESGFNGILGVGIFADDCGPFCASSSLNGRYFSCSGGGCSGATVAVANQVRNPVDRLPTDNNGVLVKLPAVAPGGAVSISGSMIIGIGTSGNNVVPQGVTPFPASTQTGRFQTTYNNFAYPAFIDTGSNALFIPGNFPACSINSGWFCPPTAAANPFGLTPQTAVNMGSGGGPVGQVSFTVENFDALFGTGNTGHGVFPGAAAPGSDFDWGLPFFFGRDVYVGIEAKPSSLATGPFWAY